MLYNENNNKKIKTITFVLRNNVLKGDFILLDVLKNITNKYKNLNINLLYNDNDLVLPFNYNDSVKINCCMGPFTRKELAGIFQKSDLYIDASFTEGFGLVPLEAMAAGNVVVVSNSGGVNDYLEDGVNGFVIDNVNDVNGYLEKIDLLLNDEKVYQDIKKNMKKTIKNFDYDSIIDEYIEFFNKMLEKKEINLTEEEIKLYNKVLNDRFKVSKDNKSKNLLYKICKKVPKGLRIKVKLFVEKIYRFTNER